MLETIFQSAFITGIVSALSMPLGAITAMFWHPRKLVLAFLIAFGGGALLAAVTVDLVSNVKERGHLLELITGSIVGSVFFIVVNQIVNHSGGFLRKPSTLLTYLARQESSVTKRRILQLKQLEGFQGVPRAALEQLSQRMWVARFPKGSTLYRPGDPSESLYFIDSGKVEILDPQENLAPVRRATPPDAIGQWEFFAGTLHQTVAVTLEETQLSVLSRSDFEDRLETSPMLLKANEQFIQGEAIAHYLHQYEHLSLPQVNTWVNQALKTLRGERKILPAVAIEQKEAEFLRMARQFRRFPVFNYLPQEDLEEVAARLLYRHFEQGTVFFQPGEVSDRVYLLHQGEIQVYYPSQLNQPPILLTPGDACGELAFVTGARHTVTAIAKSETAAWVLRKQDFNEVLQQSKHFEASIKSFLESPNIQTYLQKRQNFEPARSAAWVKQALENMNAGQLIPSAAVASEKVHSHQNAPLSIWLGLLMDAIPEALVIGAQLSHHSISPTLITGLFISNYPEALSSSKGMKEQGFSTARILILWITIMLVTGILAAVGGVFLAEASESVVSFLEAMAAGAMLTVITETMLPEAYAKGGSIAGLSTLLGFLVIIVLKSLE